MAYRKINGAYQPKYDFDLRGQISEYPEGFGPLFISDEHFRDYSEASALYIPDSDMEEQIKKAVFSDAGRLIALISERRTGKTMLLQNCLQMLAGTVHIEHESCIAFFSFRDYDDAAAEEFPVWRYLAAVSQKLAEQFPKISEYLSSEESKSGFCSFIEQVQAELLQCENESLTDVPSASDRSLLRLQAAGRHMPLDYEIRNLQYILSLPACPVKKILFCIDDLDGLEEKLRNRLVVAFLKAYSQLHVFPAGLSRYCSVSMLVSMTPDHYIQLKQEPFAAEHPFDYEQQKPFDLNLEKYFSRKLKHCIARGEIKDLEPWRRFQQLLAKASQRFSKKYDRMIKNLCLYDIDMSMKLYARILCNNHWVMQGKKTAERPWFCPEDYVLNNITVIRALACGENDMYIDYPGSVIPNILYNSKKDKKYGILSLYLMCYFSRLQEPSGICRSVSEERVVEMFSDIFSAIEYNKNENITNDNIADDTAEVIQYHLKKEILKRDFRNPYQIYLSTRGCELWNMLQSDSVLLELYREDLYREYESEGCKNNPYCSDVLMGTNQQAEIFKDLFRMIGELAEKEDQFIQAAKKNQMLSVMQETFGQKKMCAYLLSGVEKSMEYSGLKRKDDVLYEYNEAVKHLAV